MRVVPDYKRFLTINGWTSMQVKVHYDFLSKFYSKSARLKTMETAMKFKNFVPGRLFTFDYDPIFESTLDFYDFRPITLMLKRRDLPEKNSELWLGYNLHYFPHIIRPYILEEYWKMFQSLLEADEKKMKTDRRYSPGLILPYNFDALTPFRALLRKKYGDKTDLALRSYRIEKADNIHNINYSDWYKIGFIEPVSFIKTSMSEVTARYVR